MSLRKMTDTELADMAVELEGVIRDLDMRQLSLKDAKKAANEDLASVRAVQAARHRATLRDLPPPQVIGS